MKKGRLVLEFEYPMGREVEARCTGSFGRGSRKTFDVAVWVNGALRFKAWTHDRPVVWAEGYMRRTMRTTEWRFGETP